MASEESFFGRMAGVMRRVSAVWSGTLMIVLFFRFSLVGFELLAIQYPHFVAFLPYSVYMMMNKRHRNIISYQKYFSCRVHSCIRRPSIHPRSPPGLRVIPVCSMFFALASPLMILPCPFFPSPMFFFFMWGRSSSRRSSSSMPSSRPGLVTPPHPHLATTDRRLSQGRLGSSPPLFAMWLGQGQSLTKHLLQG